jgi:hypothetical protein
MTCHAIYRQKARTKSKDIDDSDRLAGGCVGQRVNHCWKQWTVVPQQSTASSLELLHSIFHYSSRNAHRHISSLWGSNDLPDDGIGTPKHVAAFD